MEATNPSPQPFEVGVGSTQLICETSFQVKPPLSKIIREEYTAEITDATVFNDKVLFTGKAEHMIYYLHAHGKKSNNDNKQEGDSNRSSDEEPADEFKVFDGSGALVDSSRGIVHFHQQVFEFTGTTEIKGVVPTDVVVGTAKVSEYDNFTAIAADESGVVSGGKKIFKINVDLSATRN